MISGSYYVSGKHKIEKSFLNLNLIFKAALIGTLKPAIYLFKASCGLGKSAAVQAFLRDWKAKGFEEDQSVLIVLSTINEIQSYIDRSGLNSKDYAVYVSDEGLSAKGIGKHDANSAPVLYTTHEMFKRRVNRKLVSDRNRFKSASEFHFNGRPRSLVIYDETLHRAQGISISYDTLAALPEFIRHIDPVVTAMLDQAMPDKGDLSDGLVIELPSDLGRGLSAILHRLEPLLNRRTKAAVDALVAAAGNTLIATRDNQGGYHLVGSCNPLPGDLPPVIVLDGSIGLRATYDLWATHKGGVTFLEAAVADYRQLTVRWWDRGCGKSTLGKYETRHQIVGVIADLINGQPTEKWLVVHPMDRSGYEGFAIPAELTGKLSVPANVSFTHWGRHVATNEFRDIKNVVIMGENRYRDQSYDAHYMAATGKAFVGPQHRKQVQIGEFGHHVYQAICRSHVRQVLDGVAGDATAYLITRRLPNKEAMLASAFTNSTIKCWQPIEGRPPTKAQRMIAEIEQAFKGEGLQRIEIRSLAQRCGGSVGKDLTRQWKDEGVKNYLAANDLERDGKALFRRPSSLAA